MFFMFRVYKGDVYVFDVFYVFLKSARCLPIYFSGLIECIDGDDAITETFIYLIYNKYIRGV